MVKEKIKFRDLSGWLKLGIIMGWVFLGEFILAFFYGFMIGLGV